MSGVIADTLAAHQARHVRGLDGGSTCWCGAFVPFREGVKWQVTHAEHQQRVLAAAGVGDLRGLLDDLRGLAEPCDLHGWTLADSAYCDGCIAAEVWVTAFGALCRRCAGQQHRTERARRGPRFCSAHNRRYAPSDPTPKEQP